MPYADSFRMETDRMNRIGFFHSVNPARHTIHIYISLSHLLSIGNKSLRWYYIQGEKGVCKTHTSLDCFFLSFGNASSPLAIGSG